MHNGDPFAKYASQNNSLANFGGESKGHHKKSNSGDMRAFSYAGDRPSMNTNNIIERLQESDNSDADAQARKKQTSFINREALADPNLVSCTLKILRTNLTNFLIAGMGRGSS